MMAEPLQDDVPDLGPRQITVRAFFDIEGDCSTAPATSRFCEATCSTKAVEEDGTGAIFVAPKSFTKKPSQSLVSLSAFLFMSA